MHCARNPAHMALPAEIVAFSDRIADFKAIDAQVVGISVDSPFSHLVSAWVRMAYMPGGR